MTAGTARAVGGEACVAAAVYAIATFVLLFPLFVSPGSTLFDPAIRGSLSLFALGDIYTVIWVMAWDAHALWTNPAGLFDANIFHPAPGALTSSEHMLGHLPIFGLVYAVSGNPVLANQLNLFVSLTLCGLAMYALLRHWGVGRLAAFAGGAVFAYCPLRLTFVTHVHLVAGQYLVLSILALDRYLLLGSRRWLAAFAIGIGLQSLCSFYLAYMSLVALAAYGAAVALRGDRAIRRRLVYAAAGAAVGLVPFLLLAVPYLGGREAGTLPAEQEQALLRYLSAKLHRLFLVREEGYYAGLSVALLAVIGWWNRTAARQTAWARAGTASIALVCIAFAMGPDPEILGYSVPSPYAWASWAIPGFAAMRGPIRFILIVMVGLAALAGLGLDRLERVPRAGRWLVVAAIVAVSWDYGLLARRFPVRDAEVGARVPQVYRALAAMPPGPVVELPAGGGEDPIEQARESTYTFRSVYHWQRLLNGRTGYVPPSYPPLMALARTLPDPRALELLQRAAGLRYVVVHVEELAPGQWSRWRETPGLRRVRRYGDSVLFEVENSLPSDLTDVMLTSSSPTTVTGTPLERVAPDGRRGSIRIVRPPTTAATGFPLPIRIVVENRSGSVWPAFSVSEEHRVEIGYRWRDDRGRIVTEARLVDRIPYDLAGGAAVEVLGSVSAVVGPGEYRLEIDVTQDREWFGIGTELPIRVVADLDAARLAALGRGRKP